MNQRLLLLLFGLTASMALHAQLYTLSGRISNPRLEPLAYASVQIKGFTQGVISDEKGLYSLKLDPGTYHLTVTMIGYLSQVIPLTVSGNTIQDIILEPDEQALLEVVVKGRARDRSEEYIRQVIRQKESLQELSGQFSCEMYIRATQENFERNLPNKKKKKAPKTDSATLALSRMAMAEIFLTFHQGDKGRFKEERTGVTKRGNPESLFFLSATEADFNLYNNLLYARTLSTIPFISPVSWSGLEAYRFKLLRTDIENGKRIYTIGVRPRALSNATIAGMIRIADSSWTLVESRFRLPEYHVPEYDDFEVVQFYTSPIGGSSVMARQQFIYRAKIRNGQLSGKTTVEYRNYQFAPIFPGGFFGPEKGSTAASAYNRDSSFWEQIRIEPLSTQELQFIRFTDSVKRVQTSQVYLDSIDSITNRVSFLNITWAGQTIYNRKKEKTWKLPAAIQMIQPFQIGGFRLSPVAWYNKTYPNRKNVNVFANISYGFRNKDVNGNLRFHRLYNPFNRGFYQINLRRDFEYIFNGDAWINMIQRSNSYLNNAIGGMHGLELANGLFLTAGADLALRRSVSDYKTNSRIDSLFGDILDNNQAIAFEPYNALYGNIRLAFTPAQQYLREPMEKIILGSKWPTFYVEWRKGIPRIFKSETDFDYLETGLQQELRLGILGISNYTIRTGNFLNRKDLRLVDYKFQRRGDPLLFLNPHEAFQSLDSTFPVFRRFYEGHLVHDFNGALLNKIPFLKKLELREVAGAGFLIAQERKLRYAELFAGIERVFHAPFNPLIRFKLGVYVVGSVANQFSNPVQFKIGITTWDKIRNKWF